MTERAQSAVPSQAGDSGLSGAVPEANGSEQVATPDSAALEGPPLCFGFDPASRRMKIDGELDFANASVLAGVMATLFRPHLDSVIVDIHDVEFADAATQTLFLASCKTLHEADVALLIDGATPTARQACHAAGLDALLAE
jgi:anti-anti-sigma factor